MKRSRNGPLASTVLVTAVLAVLAVLVFAPALRSAPPTVPTVPTVQSVPTVPTVAAVPAAAEPTATATVTATAQETIAEVVRRAHHPSLKWPDFPWYQDKMAALYGPRASAPLWVDAGLPTKQAADVVAVLELSLIHI